MLLINYVDKLGRIAEFKALTPGSLKYRRMLRELQKDFPIPKSPEEKRWERLHIACIILAPVAFLAPLPLAFSRRIEHPEQVVFAMLGLLYLFIALALLTHNRMRHWETRTLLSEIDHLYALMQTQPPELLPQLLALLNSSPWDDDEATWLTQEIEFGCAQCMEISRAEPGTLPVACPQCKSRHIVFHSAGARLTPELLQALHDLLMRRTDSQPGSAPPVEELPAKSHDLFEEE